MTTMTDTSKVTQTPNRWALALMAVVAAALLAAAVIFLITNPWGFKTSHEFSFWIGGILIAVISATAFVWTIVLLAQSASQEATQNNRNVAGLIAALLAMCIVLSATYILVRVQTQAPAEIMIGIAIAIVLVAMITVLFTVAAGFSFLGLASPSFAFGLPEGSIRALIALFLIQIFIVFGIYIHSQSDNYYGPFKMTVSQSEAMDGVVLIVPAKGEYGEIIPGYVDVYMLKENENQARLAQQLLTTVGTLVVAVAGFYFGSNSVSKAIDASAVATNASLIKSNRVNSFSPSTGKRGESVKLTVTGDGFSWPMRVRLTKDAQQILATNIQVRSPSELLCDMNIPSDAEAGSWNVVVESDGGGAAQSPGTFKVTD